MRKVFSISVRAGVLILSCLWAGASAGSTEIKSKDWKYAGEDHGIRFFFKLEKYSEVGAIRLMLVNTMKEELSVDFRVRDTDWKKSFTRDIPGADVDSSLVYLPIDGEPVCHPFIDKVFVETQSAVAPEMSMSSWNGIGLTRSASR